MSQQIAAKYGRQRQGYNGGGEQRYDESHAQRHEHASFHAAQEEQRDETDDNDERRVQDGHAHFPGGVEYDIAYT